MTYHQDIGEWHGKGLVDRNGEKIGKLEDVYVDVETNEPMFATVKEGLIGRHLTFVPLAGITIGPDNLQVTVSKEEVKTAPTITSSTPPRPAPNAAAGPPAADTTRSAAVPSEASHATSRSSWASASA